MKSCVTFLCIFDHFLIPWSPDPRTNSETTNFEQLFLWWLSFTVLDFYLLFFNIKKKFRNLLFVPVNKIGFRNFTFSKVHIGILRRPQNFAKSPPWIWPLLCIYNKCLYGLLKIYMNVIKLGSWYTLYGPLWFNFLF
jgi:hypothetical protein